MFLWKSYARSLAPALFCFSAPITLLSACLSSAAYADKNGLRHIAVVGAQWGDEGKGSFADKFPADITVRYNGGNNAGHTVVVGKEVFKLRSLPSGVVRNDRLNLIGNGAVVCPQDLLKEIADNRQKGLRLTPEELLVAENAPLVLSVHKHLDLFREKQKEKTGKMIGTTGNGIGPAYEDKVGRRAIRAGDLVALDEVPAARANLKALIEQLVAAHYPELRSFAEEGLVVEKFDKNGNSLLRLDAKALFADRAKLLASLEEEMLQIAPAFAPYVAIKSPVWRILADADRDGKRILFEGGQAVMLDIDHGTYPYVTSSNTLGTSIFAGSGFATRSPIHVIGVAKAYVTRVGKGPFPSKMETALAETVRARGHEYGTVTGRPRDIGWLDLVALKQAVVVGGIHSLALTKADILDGFETIKVVTSYRHGRRTLDHVPSQAWMWDGLEAVTEDLAGWQKSHQVRAAGDLPRELMALIAKIEATVGVPVVMVGTGPERDDKVVLDARFDM